MNQRDCASISHACSPAGSLEALFAQHALRDPSPVRERLRQEGIDAAKEAEIRTRRNGLFCGLARVLPHGGRYFDFDETGRWCCILPELWCEEIVDLIAFSLREPKFLATYCGLTALLGEEGVSREIFVTGETKLWDDPLQWLKAGGEGGVPLEFDPPPSVLHGARVKCGSIELAERLLAAMAMPRLVCEVQTLKGGRAA